MRIAILTGSIRQDRQSFKVALYIEKILTQKKAILDLIDLNEMHIPFLGDHTGDYAGVEKLRGILHQADAIILVSPEYHGSFSGVLKNALDHFWAEFKKKPIAVATASSGMLGGINASVQLQHIILSLGAYPLPVKLIVPEIQLAFDEALRPTNVKMETFTNNFLDELIWFTGALTAAKQ